MKIIAGTTHFELAKIVSRELNAELVKTAFHKFDDGEFKVNIANDLKYEDVFIIQSTCAPANDNLIELLLIIDAAKRASAKTITTIIPYIGYSRQDKLTSKSSLGIGLIASLLEAAGANKVITLDIHSTLGEKFFKIPIINLSTSKIFLAHIDIHKKPFIIAPDVGGIERAQKIAESLMCDLAVMSKKRISSSECIITELKGNVQGRHCILIDDIIDTAATICSAANFLIKHGACSVEAFITHGIFSSDAFKLIENSHIWRIHVTDTIPRNKLPSKLKIIPIKNLIIEACLAVCQ